MKKSIKIIMLPTEHAENSIIKKGNQLKYETLLLTQSYLNSINCKSYHLYFISDEEIEVGDYGYVPIGKHGTIGKVTYDKKYDTWDLTTKDNVHYPFSTKCSIKKVIATTAKFIIREYWSELPEHGYDPRSKTGGKIEVYLPTPTKDFIKAYVKQEGISEVLVEYEVENINLQYKVAKVETLKVNEYNEITIYPIKTSWDREEINLAINTILNEVLCTQNPDIRRGTNSNEIAVFTTNWMNKNL